MSLHKRISSQREIILQGDLRSFSFPLLAGAIFFEVGFTRLVPSSLSSGSRVRKLLTDTSGNLACPIIASRQLALNEQRLFGSRDTKPFLSTAGHLGSGITELPGVYARDHVAARNWEPSAGTTRRAVFCEELHGSNVLPSDGNIALVPRFHERIFTSIRVVGLRWRPEQLRIRIRLQWQEIGGQKVGW